MITVYPDYYKKFSCKKEKCRHNCCIGWEIDIDEEKTQYYKNIGGEMGKKLKNNIANKPTPHFILDKNERCPFLNKDNLCELVINLGEDSLCEICSLHPRFQNLLPERTEIGLGLCCEAATELIIGNRDTVNLINNTTSDDEIIILRDKIISVLQERSLNINLRVKKMLDLCQTDFEFTKDAFDEFLALERLEGGWTEVLYLAKENYTHANFDNFDRYIKDREYEYEQFLVYLIYRHFANSIDLYSAAQKAKFAAMAYRLIYYIGGALFQKYGELPFEMQTDIMRMFSAEIEYSDENLYSLIG